MTEPLAIFEENLAWATRLARNVHRHLPPSFDLDDLVQEAHIALWKKSQLYDPATGVPFQGFAALYVRGAVLMVCRRRHWKDHTTPQLNTQDEDEKDFNPCPIVQMPVLHTDPLLERERQESEDRLYQTRHQWLLREMEKLPTLEAELCRRVYIDGADLDDVSRECQMERRTISCHLKSAARRLKRIAECQLTTREPEPNGKRNTRTDHAMVA